MRPTVSYALAAPARTLAALRRPATHTDLLQIVKSVLAAVAAWLLAVNVFGLAQPFLAPWAALLTVHATVYRTLSRGAQSVAATVLGIGLSFAAAQVLGLGAATLGVALLAGMLLSRAGLLREEGVTVATTALFVLTTGFEQQEAMLLDRLLDTAIGVGVGVLVNLAVLPPLNHRSAEQQIDAIDRQMGELMTSMATEMRETWTEEHSADWIERTREMDENLSHAWRLVQHARESNRWNPRRLVSRDVGDPTAYEQVLQRIEDGIAQLRSIARTVDESTRSAQEWDPRFRGPWLDLLAEVGRRVADPDADVNSMHERIDDLTRDLSGEDLPGLLWPVYGALISNLLNVVDIVDDVATARPVRP
ncbi:MAG: FUSC family protein [Nocardioidaceae bacterium]